MAPPETVAPPEASGSQPPPPPAFDDEGLYTIPSPASDASDNHPFGVVPGWIPQLHPDISNHWAWLREMHKRQELPDPRKKVLKEAPPQATSSSKSKPKKTKSPKKEEKGIVWLHHGGEPLPEDLPGQKATQDELGNELPRPNDLRDYLLPDETRHFSIANRPTSVLSPTHIFPPFGIRPRTEARKRHRGEDQPKVTPPGRLPVYGSGPLFKNCQFLSEIAAPLPDVVSTPEWVSLPEYFFPILM